MNASTTDRAHLVPVTEPGADRDTWLTARAQLVTASVVHGIAVGGRATWQRYLADKLNGSTFKGNTATERGHNREPYLLAFARGFIDPSIDPNDRLFLHPMRQRIGATPDALGGDFGVEVKSHGYGWGRDDIPAEHYDQMQLGMFVTGFDRWLYMWEVMGEDGEPTLDDPEHVWVQRDERRIAFLVREAERFLSWWDAGAPATDDLPAEIDDALAKWADARSRKKDAEADEKAAETIIRKHIAATPGAEIEGAKLAGRAAQLVYTVTEKDVLDAVAWAAHEPDTHAAWVDLNARAEATAEAAFALYRKPTRSTRLNITATKDAA